MMLPERRGGTPTARRWDPFSELDDFRERMSRMLDRSFGGLAETVGDGRWSPLVDIEETEDAYVFEADVPGAQRDRIQVEVEANELRISGEIEEREHSGTLRRQSRMTGRFEYRAGLPGEVDTDQVEATLKDGVLTVRVPKSPASHPKRIEIRT